MRTKQWWTGSPEANAYYQTEWGRPEHDDQRLFEILALLMFQAGLSWRTVLRKRPALRQAFAQFEPARVSQMQAIDVERLLRDPKLIRNRRKIEAVIHNAQVVQHVQTQFGSFDQFVWDIVAGQPIVAPTTDLTKIARQTPLSKKVAIVFKQNGFTFVGPTLLYSFMQAAGLVDHHLESPK